MKSRLTALMQKARLTYRALSQESGVESSTLFRIARGDQDARMSTVFSICEVLSARLRTPISAYDLFPTATRDAIKASRKLRAPAPVSGEAGALHAPSGEGAGHDGE